MSPRSKKEYYKRFDDPRVVVLLNDFYRNEWRLFHNFFCPSVKLISKERVGSKPSSVTIYPEHRISGSWHQPMSRSQSNSPW